MVEKRNLSGPKSAPEMPVRIFWTAHGACKPVLTQTPSLSFHLTPHISISKFSVCFPQTQKFQSKTIIWRRNWNNEKPEQEAGAEAGMRQVLCVSAEVCSCMQGCALCQPFVSAINEAVVVVALWSCPAWTRSPSSWPFVALQMV